MGIANERLGISQGAEHRVNVAIVRDVVSPVALRTREKRAEPHGVDAERSQIVETCSRTRQVSDAVTIAVGK